VLAEPDRLARLHLGHRAAGTLTAPPPTPSERGRLADGRAAGRMAP
jgi:hypothetical protein